MTKKIRWAVFLPPWLLVVATVALSFIDYDAFVKTIDFLTSLILDHFTWAFCLLTFSCVVLVCVSFFSPIGKMRVGGDNCKSLVSYRNYLWITLCTIMAAGIMFWACAEPMYHIYQPPGAIESGSTEAIKQAMNTMLLEWTFTPMCLYCIPTLLFAFVFYNMKLPFSLGSMLTPALGEEKAKKISPLIDGICLFALCGGMSASLGQGVLLLSGGIEDYSNGFYQSSVALWCVCTAVIVAMFVISASTGITKGIKILSNVNITFYSVIVLCLFLFGPTLFVLDFGVESIGNYLNDFVSLSLFTGASGGKEWVESWPGFYWCNWLAWMPITGVFLGKVSKGFTFRQVITAVVIVPALFSMMWIILFSGTAIYLQMENGSVWAAMQSGGTEAATYVVLRSLPLSGVLIGVFLVVLLLSFVTAAHSNTNAMSGICTKGLTVDSSESPTILKIIWGVTIGGTCLIMLSTYGINGIKMLSNLAGFPDALLMIFFMVSWIKILKNPEKYSRVLQDNNPCASVTEDAQKGGYDLSE